MRDWTKVTDNEEVIRLIKEREKIEEQIRVIDEMAWNAEMGANQSLKLENESLKQELKDLKEREAQTDTRIAALQGIELAEFRKFILLHTFGDQNHEWFEEVYKQYLNKTS